MIEHTVLLNVDKKFAYREHYRRIYTELFYKLSTKLFCVITRTIQTIIFTLKHIKDIEIVLRFE